MTTRKIELANEERYHICNRGVDKRVIFQDQKDYERFLHSMYLLNCEEDRMMEKWRDFKKFNPKARPKDFREIKPEDNLVEFNFYCLNENHFHFGMQQLKDKGIETFMQKIGTSYSMYFNKKYDRSGSLFQGPFKSAHIDTNEYFLYVSVYVNANHFIHGYENKARPADAGLALGAWPYSSLPDYLGHRSETLCNMKPILDQFRDVKEYKKFVIDNALYIKEKKEMEKYTLE